ncbi:MAG: hypothetical protein RLZ98_691 [Pseudomonadota bacterium]|jgi:arylformamidase
MKVFRDYEQAALELQYNGSGRSPELADIRQAQQEKTDALTATVKASAKCHLDVAYGSAPREKLDLFFSGTANAPLLVFIHGGYWKSRSKDEFSYLAAPYIERGVNVATISYPLAPAARLTEIVDAAQRAIAFLYRAAGEFGHDGNRIHVSGHSAGGHLTAMMMATDWSHHGVPPDLIKSGTCISGLYDLTPIRLVEVNKELKIDDDEEERLSPVRLTPKSPGPLILTVGDVEAEEFIRNAEELAAAWRKAGALVKVVPSPGHHHFTITEQLATPGNPLFEATFGAITGR